MFKKITEYKGIRNVLEFQVFESNLIFFQHIDTETELISTEANGNLLWKQNLQFDAHNFHIKNNNIYVPNEPDLFILDANTGNLKEELKDIGYLGFPVGDGKLFVYSKFKDIYTASIINNGAILWQLRVVANFGLSKSIEILLGFTDIDEWGQSKKNSFTNFSLDTGTPLWHFSLTTLNDLYPDLQASWEVWHFVGVVDDILWVCVSAKQDKWLRSKGGALLGLEASTGHIKHFLYHTHPQTEKALAHLPEYRATGYDANKNILLGISLYHYWEVDLSDAVPQIKMWNLEEEAKKYKAWFAEITLGAISPTHIFALSGQSSIEIESQVSALNRETLQIDWHYVFAQPKGGILHPTKAEVTDTHLFVLDSQGTLHIFEKE